MFRILRIHHQGVTLCLVEVADVFILEIVQIVQRQGVAVIIHVIRFSLQEPVVCGLVAGLRVCFNQLLKIF
jgi:hypothetical protein